MALNTQKQSEHDVALVELMTNCLELEQRWERQRAGQLQGFGQVISEYTEVLSAILRRLDHPI